jgi:hypothetical protein
VIAVLARFAYLPDCTLGWLDADTIRLATIERPWIRSPDGPGGKRRESCVPDGTYFVRPHSSDKFPDTFALVNPQLGVWYQPEDMPEGQAWGRSAILIHAGNRVGDVVGCIAVGIRHSVAGSERVVLESRKALDQLRAVLGKETHSLQIHPTSGTSEVI